MAGRDGTEVFLFVRASTAISNNFGTTLDTRVRVNSKPIKFPAIPYDISEARVMTYDERGNLLSRTRGLRDGGDGSDLTTPETATESTEYYPAGHPNQFLLSARIDAAGNRTDYEYDAAHRLV